MPIELKAGANTLSLQASGKDGKDGASVINMYIDNTSHLICVLSNGEVIDAGAIPDNSYIIQYEETLTTGDIKDIIERFDNGHQIIVVRVSHEGQTDETHLQYRMVRYTDNYLYFENTFAYSGTNTIQTAMVTINRANSAWSREIYNTYKDSYIDLIKGTFVATYGNTPLEEIYAAFNAGKTVVCASGNTLYTLTSCSSTSATFTKVTFADADTSNPARFQLATFNVTEGGYQSIQYKYIETSRANGGSSTTVNNLTSKVSVINDTNAAIDRAFPNVKAVKDYVDDSIEESNFIDDFQVLMKLNEDNELVVDSYTPTDVEAINKCHLCRVEFPNGTTIVLHRYQKNYTDPFPSMMWSWDDIFLTVDTWWVGEELVVKEVYYGADLENFPIRNVLVNGEELPKTNIFDVEIPFATVTSGSNVGKAGVVKVASENGITLDSNNQLQTVGVSEAQLDLRTNTKRVITSHRLDYAFMKCFTDPKLKDASGRVRNWTDEERLAALRTLGCTVDSNGFVKWTAQ